MSEHGSTTRQAGITGESQLASQIREAGMLHVVCDESGQLVGIPPHGRDWFADLFCRSRWIQKELIAAAEQWREQSEPARTQLLPGIWVCPNRLRVRRRNSGYSLIVILAEPFLADAPFDALCQSSGLDRELAARMIKRLPPVPESDLDRIHELIKLNVAQEAKLLESSEATESLSQQLAESYEELSLLYTMSQNMSVVDRPDQFVNLACSQLLDTLPYRWIAAVFVEDEINLKKLSREFIMAGEPPAPREQVEALARVLLSQAEPNKPIVLEPELRSTQGEFLSLGRTAIAQPMMRDERVLGLMLAGEKQGSDLIISSADLKLLEATANHTGIFVENAALYEDINAMFLGTLEALTMAIDAKDRYTRGHSQRVALLTRQLALATGLDDHAVTRMWIAAQVHDIGKIGVPESVLTKPGRLTDEEFDLIKLHPEIGHRILRDIPQLNDILPGVLHHHERWDGKGYPHGLAGEDIPHMARIIAIADSFDAMSSDRTYRNRLEREEVLEEFRKCAGTQFDPDLVPLFVELDFSQFDRLVKVHQTSAPSMTHDHTDGGDS